MWKSFFHHCATTLQIAAVLLAALLPACAPVPTPVPPQLIKETVIVEKLVEKTVIVEKPVEKVVEKVVRQTVVVDATPPSAVIVRASNAPLPSDQYQVARQAFLLEAFKIARPDVIIAPSPYQYDPKTFATRFASETLEDTYLAPWSDVQSLINGNYAANISTQIQNWTAIHDIKPRYRNIGLDLSGEIYGIPVSANAYGLLYRRDLFTQAGLDPDSPPQNWEALKEACRVIQEKLTGVTCLGLPNTGSQAGRTLLALQASFGQENNEVSAGGGKWTATFNNASMVKALQLWQALYAAGYLPKSLAWGEVEQAQRFSSGKLAMTIAQGSRLEAIIHDIGVVNGVVNFDINSAGMGRMPDGGGSGSLGDGTIWLYNPKSDPATREAALEWNLWRDFDLTAYEEELKALQAAGSPIGYPEIQIFGGSYGRERAAIYAKYASLPIANYQNYMDSPVVIVSEPPFAAVELTNMLSDVTRRLLANTRMDPQVELNKAVKQFQINVLDTQK